jgi:cell division GTPase FtsZ
MTTEKKSVLHGSRMQFVEGDKNEDTDTDTEVPETITPEESEEKQMSDEMDDFLMGMDIPMPDENAVDSENVEDDFEAAFKLAFVGCGQGGSRIAESFYKLGYKRVCCVNTTDQDLKGIDIPDKNKLVIGDGHGGAGKNPENGAKAAASGYEDIYDLMRRSFGSQFDRIIVCVGAGGGTGTGSCETVINIARDIATSFKVQEEGGLPAVGVIASMPKVSEGGRVNANAHGILSKLFDMVGGPGRLGNRRISPLIIVDNDRINKIYPQVAASKFWDVANRSITGLFHLFNSIAVKDSDFTTFDPSDFKDILDSGVLTFGACPIKKWDEASDISHSIRDNLKRNVLVGGFDLKQARAAGCVFLAHSSVLDEIPQEYLEHGFEMLTRIMQPGSVLHRGIYKGGKGLVVYSILGDLKRPGERMDEIARIGGVGIDKA